MARKDVVDSPQIRLEQFQEDNEEWLKKAHEATKPWQDREEYLVVAVAKALKATYEAAIAGKPKAPVPPTRIKRSKPEPEPTNRKRRVRPAS